MPFNSTDSLTSTNMNNTLRGLYRDNSDHAVTGTTNETTLATTTVTANTIGATGILHVIAAGTITGAAGNKTVKLVLGSTTLLNSGATAGTADWGLEAWITNTATNAQRVRGIVTGLAAATTYSFDFITGAEDTTADVVLKVTGTLTNGGDTITQKMFNVFVCQIT